MSAAGPRSPGGGSPPGDVRFRLQSFLITLDVIDWSAAILAGGRARRLGGLDKSALQIGGRSILDRQLAVLRGLTPHIFIVAQDARRLGRDVRVVMDQIPDAGPLGGVYTALRASPVDRVVVLACDMPFVTQAFVRWLAARDPEADVVLPRDARGVHPLCAVYHVRMAGRLRQQIEAGQLAVHSAIDGCRIREIGLDELAPFDPDGRLLMNVNTQEDLDAALNAEP